MSTCRAELAGGIARLALLDTLEHYVLSAFPEDEPSQLAGVRAPSVMVRKWLPASCPTILAKHVPP